MNTFQELGRSTFLNGVIGIGKGLSTRMRNSIFREFHLWQSLIGCLLVTCAYGSVHGAEPSFFRLGTGGESGAYFPIGQIIAESISDSHTLGIAQLSNGSVSNATDLFEEHLEAALVQADVAYWAYTATGPFEGQRAFTNLRAIANLYPETLHLVARTGSEIARVSDLRGKRVALDEPGSGTLIDVKMVINAFGLDVAQLQAIYLKPVNAIDRLLAGELDAFFLIAGQPIAAIDELTANGIAYLVPITGASFDQLLTDEPIFSKAEIRRGSYRGQTDDIPTVAVGAQLLVRADIDDETVYRVTERLWSPESLERLTKNHPKGHQIQLDSALTGLTVPIHPGARRYYEQRGLWIAPAIVSPDELRPRRIEP